MSDQIEKLNTIRHAVEIAKRKLAELDAKEPFLTRKEIYLRDMTVDCIKRGERILGADKAAQELNRWGN